VGEAVSLPVDANEADDLDQGDEAAMKLGFVLSVGRPK